MAGPRYTVHVGPGHATHASWTGEETVCGVERRTGNPTNSRMPYRPERVDCKRCRKRLGLDDPGGA